MDCSGERLNLAHCPRGVLRWLLYDLAHGGPPFVRGVDGAFGIMAGVTPLAQRAVEIIWFQDVDEVDCMDQVDIVDIVDIVDGATA